MFMLERHSTWQAKECDVPRQAVTAPYTEETSQSKC
jgi:hypothetical protein